MSETYFRVPRLALRRGSDGSRHENLRRDADSKLRQDQTWHLENEMQTPQERVLRQVHLQHQHKVNVSRFDRASLHAEKFDQMPALRFSSQESFSSAREPAVNSRSPRGEPEHLSTQSARVAHKEGRRQTQQLSHLKQHLPQRHLQITHQEETELKGETRQTRLQPHRPQKMTTQHQNKSYGRQIIHSALSSEESAIVTPERQARIKNTESSAAQRGGRRILSGQEALATCSELFADYEQNEVKQYEALYFIGTQTSKIARMSQGKFDTKDGEYIAFTGEHLNYRFEVEKSLGRGSFGQVFRCRDHRTGQGTRVAIKMIRSAPRFQKQAHIELRILQAVRKRDPRNQSRVIGFLDAFTFRNHMCLVFPLYSWNLYEVLRANSLKGLPEPLVFAFSKQLLSAMHFLKSAGIMHCDIKPENILLEVEPHRIVDKRKAAPSLNILANGSVLSSAKIRLADLGSACFEGEQVHTYIQSRFYRAPEVILGASTGLEADMWSCGCVIAELMLGVPLFPGQTETQQIALIVASKGLPERVSVYKNAKRWNNFFSSKSGSPRWLNMKDGNSKSSKEYPPLPGSISLDQSLAAGSVSDVRLIKVVNDCLIYDPVQRISPSDAARELL